MRRRSQGISRVSLVGLCMVVGVARVEAQPAPPPGWSWNAVAPSRGPLRILITYDMEGLSGVDRLAMTTCADSAMYAVGQARLVDDVNAVIEGLLQGGAASIDVADRHGSGCEKSPDLPASRLHPRAREMNDRGPAFVERVRRGDWDAAVIVGGHASPGRGGFLEHVGSFGFERIINGVSISESEQSALLYGGVGVPVIFASGDDRYGTQLRERMPWVTFAEVKRATSVYSAELRPLDMARAELVRLAKVAIAQRDRAMAMALVPPFTGAYRPVWPQSLEPLSAIPGVDVSKGEIAVTGNNLGEVNQAINRVAGVVASFTTSDIMWELIEQDPQLDVRRHAAFMAKWKDGGPKRRE